MFVATKTIGGRVLVVGEGEDAAIAITMEAAKTAIPFDVKITKGTVFASNEDEVAEETEEKSAVLVFPYPDCIKKSFAARGILVEGNEIPAEGAGVTIADVKADSMTEGDTTVETEPAVSGDANKAAVTQGSADFNANNL